MLPHLARPKTMPIRRKAAPKWEEDVEERLSKIRTSPIELHWSKERRSSYGELGPLPPYFCPFARHRDPLESEASDGSEEGRGCSGQPVVNTRAMSSTAGSESISTRARVSYSPSVERDMDRRAIAKARGRASSLPVDVRNDDGSSRHTPRRRNVLKKRRPNRSSVPLSIPPAAAFRQEDVGHTLMYELTPAAPPFPNALSRHDYSPSSRSSVSSHYRRARTSSTPGDVPQKSGAESSHRWAPSSTNKDEFGGKEGSDFKRNRRISLPNLSSGMGKGKKHQRIPPVFKEHCLPDIDELTGAANRVVIAESGVRVRFGELFEGQETVVVFIRHFWCPMCQQYLSQVGDLGGRRLVIVSCGSWKLIKSYRAIFSTPFEVYTDPSLELYNAMGMTRRTLDGGPDADKGSYASHGAASGIAMVLLNAIKGRMSVWENGGDIQQLGGEFVLGPGLQCTFSHRMPTTRGHAPIYTVLNAFGKTTPARVVVEEADTSVLIGTTSAEAKVVIQEPGELRTSVHGEICDARSSCSARSSLLSDDWCPPVSPARSPELYESWVKAVVNATTVDAVIY